MKSATSILTAATAVTILALNGSAFVSHAPPTHQYAFRVPGSSASKEPTSNSRTTLGASKEKALTKEAEKLEAILEAKRNNASNYSTLVAQTAPAVRVSLPELYDEAPGTYDAEILVASLKALGFDVVLDTNTAADLTICEEATELLHHIKARQEGNIDESQPLFTSCCPGWLFFLEKSAPDLMPYLSSCKSPMMMFGAVIKRNSQELFGLSPGQILSVGIMPCVAKRQESDEAIFSSNGIRDVDLVITTKELGSLLERHGIDPRKLEPIPFDAPFQRPEDDGTTDGLGTGAGQLFGATGGVMEASLRSVYELVTGSRLPRLDFEAVRGFNSLKETTVSLFNEETGRGIHMDLRIAVVHGLANAKALIQKMKDGEVKYDYIEVMACPGGCIGGGGQPRCADKETREQRLQTIYKLDRSLPIRRSHENPTIIRLYKDLLGGEYGSKEAHEQLHVTEQVYGRPGETSS